MRRILLINLLILSVFASVSYWTAQKEKLEAAMGSGMETVPEGGEEFSAAESDTEDDREEVREEADDFIKWVDFDVSKFALTEAYEYDRDTYGTSDHISWIDLLAWTAAYTGGVFDNDRTVYSCMTELEEQMAAGEELGNLTAELPYFSYYQEAYTAVLGGMVGEYEIEETDEDGKVTMVKKYGLKAFHPIAKGFPYTDYDDFGVSRSYGYERQHLGHDLMGQTGTPVIAVESGYVEALGWNQYGGWRIGIRSFDGLRYYYYAHLRQGFPYQPDLEEGSVVLAGDVIGYMGHTGYSAQEDTNNIDEPHLHFGMQLIFDESQKEGNGEIWIDCYQIVGFLYRQQSEVERDDETKVWRRVWQMKDPAAEAYERTRDFSMYP
ncbi:MAG: M23 family metallopeptidase [Lachnospiraceae bacterium]|nr:M23 family metallopeptidase [Lachnospiraceae bacterium]